MPPYASGMNSRWMPSSSLHMARISSSGNSSPIVSPLSAATRRRTGVSNSQTQPIGPSGHGSPHGPDDPRLVGPRPKVAGRWFGPSGRSVAGRGVVDKIDGRLGTAAHLQLRQNTRHIILDRLLRQPQLHPNLPIRPPTTHQPPNPLPPRQQPRQPRIPEHPPHPPPPLPHPPPTTQPLQHPPTHRGIQQTPAPPHHPHRRHQLHPPNLLQHIPRRPRHD